MIDGDPETLQHVGFPEVFALGDSSCPIVTSRHCVVLAEFDYSCEPPTIPWIDSERERRDMWYVKRYRPFPPGT